MAQNQTGHGRWKYAAQKVQKLGAFHNTGKHNYMLDTLEEKFCSEQTKKELAKSSNAHCNGAAYYTKPSQQHTLATLPEYHHKPLLTSHASFGEREKAIQRRLKRRRSTHLAINASNNPARLAASVTPRILTQEDRYKLRRKFKGLVRVFLAFKRIWMFHKGRVDEILQTFRGLDSLVKTPVEDSELLFNVGHFKAKKQSTVSSDVKRILSKHPTMRTDEDIHSLIVFMASYNTLAEYPMSMQRMIAQRAWYEWYDAKRVIVREGHVAYCYFYVLSGSAVMTSLDQTATQSKTVKFVSRGDSFGDLCLMNGDARECTAISKEFIELLVLKDEDFAEIFISGGLRNSKDTFLESLSFMKDWPLELLQSSGAKRAISTYYKKGTVIVSDSKNNDWIYIVKSGRCSVLKRLKGVELDDISSTLVCGKSSPVQDSPVKRFKGSAIEGVEEVRQRLNKKLESIVDQHTVDKDTVQRLIYYDPDIHVPMNGVLNDLRGMNKRRPLPPIPSTRRPPLPPPTTRPNPSEEPVESKDIYIAMELNYVPQSKYKGLTTKGPFIKPPPPTSTSQLEEIPEGTEIMEETTSHSAPEEKESENSDTTSNQNEMEQSSTLPTQSVEKSAEDIFITVGNLKKGSHFGLLEAIAGNTITHPSLSLVSHGAECVAIHKKLYMENAPLKLLDKLREELFPYPSDEKMQENLEVSLFWNKHKHSLINSYMD